MYIFSVSCGTEHINGLCNKGFIGTFIILFGFLSGFSIPVFLYKNIF